MQANTPESEIKINKYKKQVKEEKEGIQQTGEVKTFKEKPRERPGCG